MAQNRMTYQALLDQSRAGHGREARFLTAAQVRDIADRLDAPYSTLVYLRAYRGLRWGEACALRRKRLDFPAGRIIVAESLAEVGGEFHWGTTKTGRPRTVAIPEFLCHFWPATWQPCPTTLTS